MGPIDDARTRAAAVLVAAAEDVVAGRVVLFVAHGDGAASPLVACGPTGQVSSEEAEEVTRTLVHAALAHGSPQAWDAFSGDPMGSAADLGLLAALAVPVGSPPDAALYIDARDPRGLEAVRDQARWQAVAEQLHEALAERDAPSTFEPAHEEEDQPPLELESMLASPGLRSLRLDVLSALGSSAHVLITGETGTGKTLLARAFAERAGASPVVRAMLGASDDLNTIVSELFGHERGAFSGAVAKRAGLVEHADGGILLLDEVLNMPRQAQQLLLDFVQFGTYRPLGYASPAPRRARVRIVAVTNGDLQAAVREGRFREDLYYRLAGIRLHLPALRDRRSDVAGLAERMLARFAPAEGYRLSVGLRRVLAAERLDWPGNVRQLEAAVRRALDRARLRTGGAGGEVLAGDIDPSELDLAGSSTGRASPSPRPPDLHQAAPLAEQWKRLQSERRALEARERALLEAALALHKGVVAQAARELGVARTTLASRLSARPTLNDGDA